MPKAKNLNRKNQPRKKTGPKGPTKPMDDHMFKQLVGLIKIHCTQNEVCEILGMSEQTLNVRIKERGYANYRDVYTQNQAEGKASLRKAMWTNALQGHAAIQVFLAKQHLGMREVAETKVQGTIEHVQREHQEALYDRFQPYIKHDGVTAH